MDIRQLGTMALIVVVASIIIGMGSSILSELRDQQETSYGASSLPYNVSTQGLTGLTTFANWIPLIALVIVAAIVIGVIVKYLGGAGGGSV